MLLVFTPEGDKLVCRPPNPITITGRKIALIYFSSSKNKVMVLANFIYSNSVIHDGVYPLLGMSDSTREPIYMEIRPNVETLELSMLKPDRKFLVPPKDILAVCHMTDRVENQ